MFAPRKVKTHNCEKRESALTCIKKNKMLYLFRGNPSFCVNLKFDSKMTV